MKNKLKTQKKINTNKEIDAAPGPKFCMNSQSLLEMEKWVLHMCNLGEGSGMENLYKSGIPETAQTNGNLKKGGVPKVITDKIDFKLKKDKRTKKS